MITKRQHLIMSITYALWIAGIGYSGAVTVIRSTAQAWVWVETHDQPEFVRELHDYAERNKLKFNCNVMSTPRWKMYGVTMLTPSGNEIAIVNATSLNQFSVSITVFRKEKNWFNYWENLRAYISVRHKWQDLP